MADLANVGAQKSFSLAQITSLLHDVEGQLGPLVKIGNNKDGTVMVFDMDEDTPAKKADIAVDGESTVPKGATKVTDGIIYIANQKKQVTVYRVK
jgi:hypothetical protein